MTLAGLWSSPVCFVNARVLTPAGTVGTIRFGRRILDLGSDPRAADIVVDLAGAHVLPGLINAHDHLELNHFGALKRRDRYENASQWIDDLRPAIGSDPAIRRNTSYPLGARLFIGGLKNVLAGVTTVAHHNPRYREIGRRFPVRVVTRYGWAHSFALERHPVGARGEPGGNVHERCLGTPSDAPFIVHVAEGVDDDAVAELPRLIALGCLRPNTLIVHGVALTREHWSRVVAHGASLVWCPASNMFLFGRTAPVRQCLDFSGEGSDRVCLGTDSRLTGARDLLDELRVASGHAVTPRELLHMVTETAARVLRLSDVGRLVRGALADLVVLPPLAIEPADTILRASRRHVALVVSAGRPIVGDPALAPVFAGRRTAALPIVVDGVERLAEIGLARAIAKCPIREPGVACVS